MMMTGAVDPSGKPLFKDEVELQRFHKELSKLDKEVSFGNVIGSALNGATLGALLGWLVYYGDKPHRHVGKHALYGAMIAGGASLVGYAFGKSLSFAGHFVESEAKRELAGKPTWSERRFPLPTDRPAQPALPPPSPVAAGWDGDRWEPWHHHHHHHHHRYPWAVEEEAIVEQPLAMGDFGVGQLPQSFPETGQPGQLVYNLDPRRDPLLDPVSRERLYPAWLLLHWQNGDPKIIAQVQQTLGVAADGIVGQGTTNALRAFQAHAGLPATGAMDRMTMEALILG